MKSWPSKKEGRKDVDSETVTLNLRDKSRHECGREKRMWSTTPVSAVHLSPAVAVGQMTLKSKYSGPGQGRREKLPTESGKAGETKNAGVSAGQDRSKKVSVVLRNSRRKRAT